MTPPTRSTPAAAGSPAAELAPATLWTHPSADLGRTQRLLFRRRLPPGAGQGRLFLYAEHRYRLFVDGVLVSAGPVRSVWSVRPMFDAIDLSPHLTGAGGELLVEVLCLRANNFQNTPGSPGGLLAWGEVGGDDLADGWEVCLDPAWHFPTPHHSFAQGPTEVADLRLRRPQSLVWERPVVASAETGGNGARYGPLAPADLPLPTLAVETFARGWDLGVSSTRELRVGVAVTMDPARDELEGSVGAAEAYRSHQPRPKFAYAMFIHSPRRQRVEAAVFWGPHYLNGKAVEARPDTHRGHRFHAALELAEGWNLLYGELEFFGPVWGVMIGFPLEAELTVRGRPERAATSRMRVTPLMMPQRLAERVQAAGGVPADASALEKLAVRWREVPLDEPAPFPAREVSWDAFDPSASAVWDARSPLRRRLGPGEVWSVVADFGTEYLGLVEACVEGPAGVTVDLAYEERRRADGAVHLFSSNPFCEMAERFVLPGGRLTVSPVQPRGGRLVQVSFRMPPGQEGECTLHGLAVRDLKRPAASCGALSTTDPTVDWAFAVSRHTIERTLEDGYVDPWRERGLYLGDAYVAGLAHLCTTTDARHVRHAIRLFADGQRSDGQFPCVVPAYLQEPHEDFTLIYVDFVWEYLRHTGDAETATEVLAAIERMFAGSRWQASSSGLWDTHRGRVFLDWGIDPALRMARENACINALRCRALSSASLLAEALGRCDLARRWGDERAAVGEAFRRRLWLDEARGVCGGFSPGPAGASGFGPARLAERLPPEGSPLLENTVHANVLALFAGIFTGPQRDALAELVDREMAVNSERCRTRGQGGGMAELYFLRFAVEGLTDAGRPAAALRVLRDHFGLLKSLGLVTLPEAIHRALADRDSLCHCWGAWPLEWVTRRLAGVSLRYPFDPGQVRVAPLPLVRELWPLRLTAAAGLGRVRLELSDAGWAMSLDGLAGGELLWEGRRYPLAPGDNRGTWD
ncbi:MAG: hypothetical protein ACK4PI_00435 [Tepidisphaerales bacterium]